MSNYRSISRGSITVRIEGIVASTLPALLEGVGEPPSRWIVSDLTLGAWRGYWIATEFAGQLGWSKPFNAELVEHRDFSHYATTIAARIDVEASGNRSVLRTLTFVSRIIADGRPWVFVILVPRFGEPWGEDNICLLRFMSQALKDIPSRLVLVATGPDPTPLPDDLVIEWHGSLLHCETSDAYELQDLAPGLLDPEIIRELDADLGNSIGLALAGGHWLVDPRRRRSPAETPRFQLNQLAVSAKNVGWLAAYGYCFGHPNSADRNLLISEAIARHTEDSPGIAVRLFQRAAELSTSVDERTIAHIHAQGPLIAQSRFDVIARMPDHDGSNISVPALRYYVQNRAWGLLMTGHFAEAESQFAKALAAYQEDSETPEYLYLLNISALACLKLGKPSEALAREREIEARLAAAPRRYWHLEYINCLNIARLLRLLDDHAAAEAYFRRAFTTCAGLCSTPDLISFNFYLGHTFSARGRLAEAFDYWIRGGLHWVAYAAPEALPDRVAKLITGAAAVPKDSVEAVSLAWLQLLQNTMQRLSLVGDISEAVSGGRSACDEPVVFVEANELRTWDYPLPLKAVGASGWGILGSSARTLPHWTGPVHSSLRRLLHATLAAKAPPVGGLKTIVVDSRFGRGIAVSNSELMEVAIRHNVAEFEFDGERRSLTPAVRTELRRSTRFRWGDGVDRVTHSDKNGTEIAFKRYCPPLMLSSEESAAMALLKFGAYGATVQLYPQDFERGWTLLAGLELRHAVNVLLPKENGSVHDL